MNARFTLLAKAAFVLSAPCLVAGQIPVHHVEGRIHGFLILSDLDGKTLASGSSVQNVKGNRVTSELDFRFKDGSVYQETSVFSQRRTFQLLNYHLVRKGPAFKSSLDMSLNASTGLVTVRYTDQDGKEGTITDRLKLPPDLANGIVATLLGNVDPKAPETTLSMLVPTPKPRLVKLKIVALGEDPFTVGGSAAKATRYAVKVDLGGIAGIVAPIIGKQPVDTNLWMIEGTAPVFLKSEGPLFPDGPVCRIELASPVWPKAGAAR